MCVWFFLIGKKKKLGTLREKSHIYSLCQWFVFTLYNKSNSCQNCLKIRFGTFMWLTDHNLYRSRHSCSLSNIYRLWTWMRNRLLCSDVNFFIFGDFWKDFKLIVDNFQICVSLCRISSVKCWLLLKKALIIYYFVMQPICKKLWNHFVHPSICPSVLLSVFPISSRWYLLHHRIIFNQTWYGGVSSWGGVSCRKNCSP